MWTLLWAAVATARPVVALQVVDPGGTVVFDEEVEVGSVQRFEYPADSRTWRLVLQSQFREAGVQLDARLEELKGRSVNERASAQTTPAAEVAEDLELSFKRLDGAFTVRTMWADSWSAAPEGPLPDGRSRYVVVWDDADLLVHPRDPEGVERTRELPDGRQDPATQSSAFKVVHTFGDGHLEVETLPKDGATHCYGAASGRRGTAATRYVSSADTLQVTTRALTSTFEDGSGYTIAAGVVVEPRGDDRYEAVVGSLRVPIQVSSPDDVGARYRPSSHFPSQDSGLRLRPVDGVIGDLPTGPVRWTGEGAPTVQGRVGVRSPIVTIRDACAEVRLRTTVDRLQRSDP